MERGRKLTRHFDLLINPLFNFLPNIDPGARAIVRALDYSKLLRNREPSAGARVQYRFRIINPVFATLKTVCPPRGSGLRANVK